MLVVGVVGKSRTSLVCDTSHSKSSLRPLASLKNIACKFLADRPVYLVVLHWPLDLPPPMLFFFLPFFSLPRHGLFSRAFLTITWTKRRSRSFPVVVNSCIRDSIYLYPPLFAYSLPRLFVFSKQTPLRKSYDANFFKVSSKYHLK